MIGVGKRLIADETVKRTACDRCDTEESLTVKVYSKFFMLKILPFALNREIYVDCSSCKRVESNIAVFPRRTQDRIEAITDDAKHPWYLYLGYVIITGALLIGIIAKQ
ncbi:hypothetical protein [Kordia jejudonensis]|uniref:hypothetical protein n=1 Tax=Kordia jejudonensis TaxID=1348245 RepID=UPI00062963AF|nr:hypothetical protein [Kordia jejudonensis]